MLKISMIQNIKSVKVNAEIFATVHIALFFPGTVSLLLLFALKSRLK